LTGEGRVRVIMDIKTIGIIGAGTMGSGIGRV